MLSVNGALGLYVQLPVGKAFECVQGSYRIKKNFKLVFPFRVYTFPVKAQMFHCHRQTTERQFCNAKQSECGSDSDAFNSRCLVGGWSDWTEWSENEIIFIGIIFYSIYDKIGQIFQGF